MAPARPRKIRTLLVANRGEIARRVMRTCRALGIRTVAVFSDADRDAPFVAEADAAIRIGRSAPSESYLRGEAIVAAALRARADAVHPGYGFLSEEAAFARQCEEAGLVFVGPPAPVLAAMGKKLEAKEIAAAAGVPVLPSLTLSGSQAAELRDPARASQAIASLGLPLLVKASAGGGGKGMRRVDAASDLAASIEAAEREALGAFGDATVFLERLVERPRHVEVQIAADAHGNVAHLFERECSIQRRHQKVVEEAPSPAVDESLRERIGAAAVAVARRAGYVGLGTVELLLAPDGSFYFLEVNARLQVEHPVTELVTGLDLVELQLAIAEGAPLPPEARSPSRTGHALEVRLYAEDPEHDLLPATGTLHVLEFPQEQGLRVDTGVVAGSVVGPHYDPMLAKVIAHGVDRDDAVRRLVSGLRRTRIHGVRNNRDLLVGILEHPDFVAGSLDTEMLDRHAPIDLARASRDPAADRVHAVAAALAAQAERRASARVLATLPSGWRNVASAPQSVTFESGGTSIEVAYRFTRDALEVAIDGMACGATSARTLSPHLVELEVDGWLHRVALARAGDRVYADSPIGWSELRERPRFPATESAATAGSLEAPMPGTVLRVTVAVGDRVAAGDELVVLEAMKMEHRIRAAITGVVEEIRVRAGDTVEAGHVLVVLAPRDESEAAAGRAADEQDVQPKRKREGA